MCLIGFGLTRARESNELHVDQMRGLAYLVEECVQFIFAEFSLKVFDLLRGKGRRVVAVDVRLCYLRLFVSQLKLIDSHGSFDLALARLRDAHVQCPTYVSELRDTSIGKDSMWFCDVCLRYAKQRTKT